MSKWKAALPQIRAAVTPAPTEPTPAPPTGPDSPKPTTPPSPAADLPYGLPVWIGNDHGDAPPNPATTTASTAAPPTPTTPWSGAPRRAAEHTPPTARTGRPNRHRYLRHPPATDLSRAADRHCFVSGIARRYGIANAKMTSSMDQAHRPPPQRSSPNPCNSESWRGVCAPRPRGANTDQRAESLTRPVIPMRLGLRFLPKAVGESRCGSTQPRPGSHAPVAAIPGPETPVGVEARQVSR